MEKLMVAVARVLLLCAVWLMLPAVAAAFPIAAPGTEGLEVTVSSTGPVVATYHGNSARYSNDLYLMLDGSGNPGDDGNPTNDLFIFNNHTSPPGSTVTLGSFPIGTKLIFRLHVNNTGIDYFTGLGSRNPDSQPHARAQADWMPDETLVSFEDLFNGPFNYNDLSFSFIPTTASGPAPGWYSPGSPLGGAALIHDDSSGLRIVWANSYIYQHPGTDNLYWYAQVLYINDGSQILQINCSEQADQSLFKEHIRGTEGLPPGTSGYVPADETFCSRNPSTIISIGPGEAFYDWAIFHNVPPSGEVALEWGLYGSSPWVNPWYRPYPSTVPPPAECPPELVTLGTCQPGPRPIMATHLSTEPDGKAPHLIVLVHGCCTDPDGVREWDRLADEIVEAIIKNNLPRAWEIVVWDWHEHTPNGILPFVADKAYRAAENEARDFLAPAIANYPYKHVHLIGHSAGANLIDTVATELFAISAVTGHKPFIHLTFLDAYTPVLQTDELTYGANANYAEHYVDKSTGGLSPTDKNLTYAFNFDITDWSGADKGQPGGHQWPRWWYEKSVTTAGFRCGFALSVEGGNDQITLLPKQNPREEPARKLNNADCE